ncbi:MAG TPA: hypothetical protein VMG12_39130 [Polyangiaceae bacterium]|nr:hypothetical protein [Polyangiaceae bacterium]
MAAIGVWSIALLCGSLAACSGTIETPTEEFPARTGGNSAAADDDDDAPPPRNPTPAASNDDDDDVRPPPAASNDDDDPVPPAGNDDEEEPAPADDEPAPAGGDISFATDVQPIFNSTCGPCHAEQGLAGVSIGNPDIDTAYDSAVDREEGVFRRIEAGTMPPPCGGGAPGDPGCISEEDLATIEAWYDAGTPE